MLIPFSVSIDEIASARSSITAAAIFEVSVDCGLFSNVRQQLTSN
jgi:hypothetical protein